MVLDWLVLAIHDKTILASTSLHVFSQKSVFVNHFNIFLVLWITWQVHNTEPLYFSPHVIKMCALFFPTLWYLTFPEQAVKDTNNSTETSSDILTCEGHWAQQVWKHLIHLQKKIKIYLIYLQTSSFAVPHRLKTGGVI